MISPFPAPFSPFTILHSLLPRRLVKELEGQFAESARLEKEIRLNLQKMSFGGPE